MSSSNSRHHVFAQNKDRILGQRFWCHSFCSQTFGIGSGCSCQTCCCKVRSHLLQDRTLKKTFVCFVPFFSKRVFFWHDLSLCMCWQCQIAQLQRAARQDHSSRFELRPRMNMHSNVLVMRSLFWKEAREHGKFWLDCPMVLTDHFFNTKHCSESPPALSSFSIDTSLWLCLTQNARCSVCSVWI